MAKKSKFFKLCEYDGKKYAVICTGATKTVEMATYAVDRHMTTGFWVVTLVYNGVMVGRGYSTEKEALDDIERIHEHLKTLNAKDFPDRSELEKATTIKRDEYVQMIWGK